MSLDELVKQALEKDREHQEWLLTVGLFSDGTLNPPSLIPGCTCSLRVQRQVLEAIDTSLHWGTCPTTRVEPTP